MSTTLRFRLSRRPNVISLTISELEVDGPGCQNESRREHPVLWNPSALMVATLPKDQLSDLAARPPLFRSLLISSAIRARTLISNTVPADREVLDPRCKLMIPV